MRSDVKDDARGEARGEVRGKVRIKVVRGKVGRWIIGEVRSKLRR
jgi:hypothetical protein